MNRHFEKTRRQTVLLAAVAFWVAVPAQAQDPSPQATSAAAAPPSEPLGTLAGVQGADKGSAFQAQFDASTDQKTATGVIGWKDGAGVYALTFQGPLNTKTKEATPISLDGLSNGSSVQFAANHLFWSGPDLDEQAEIKKLCARISPGKPCDYQKMEPGRDREKLAELLHLNDVPWYLGVSGGVSVTRYNFLEGRQLQQTSDTKTDYSVTARIGVFRPLLGFLIGSIGYQQTSVPGADSVSVCRPLQGTDATTCSDAVLKGPTDTRGALVTFQMRRKLAGDVAMAPMIQRDVKKEVTSVIIPVYFLKDAKGSPIGGVRGSWRSDTKSVVISLFVGAAFGLTP